jgi:hypothetical protein
MNNLERKLIELTFPTVNVDSLMEIIVATPNATVATEILCGVYQEPEFVQNKLSPNGVVARTFISYDKWNEQVEYMYLQEEIKYEYFPKSVDKETITVENYKSLTCGYNDDSYRHGVKTGVMETRTDWCSVGDWNRLKDNNFELSGAELEATL